MRRALLGALPGLLLLATLGCSRAGIEDMTAGGNIITGELECWLHLAFDEPPDGVDPTDITVVFSSDALEEDTEFDWSWIAAHDVTAGQDFGSGNRPNPDTDASTPPPLGEVIKVRFPMVAKRRLDETKIGALWLEAELWWGDERQDSTRQDIRRLYKGEQDRSTLPGY